MKFEYKSSELEGGDRVSDVPRLTVGKKVRKWNPLAVGCVLLALVGVATAVGIGLRGKHAEVGVGTVSQDDVPPPEVNIQFGGASNPCAGRRKLGLCVGINEVSPQVYPMAEMMKLKGCCNDADQFGALLRKIGYSVAILKNSEGNRSNVERALNAAAKQLSDGDIFAVLISGHGGRDEQTDGKKHESWVLYDGLVWDSDIIAAFSRFRKGVRILVVNDQCHSGGVFLEKRIASGTYRRYWSANTKDLSWTAEKAVASPDFPQLIQFASSRAEQPSKDCEMGGVWTIALIRSFTKDPHVTFSSWFNQAFAEIPRGMQEPQWVEKGPVSQEFRNERVCEGEVAVP